MTDFYVVLLLTLGCQGTDVKVKAPSSSSCLSVIRQRGACLPSLANSENQIKRRQRNSDIDFLTATDAEALYVHFALLSLISQVGGA